MCSWEELNAYLEQQSTAELIRIVEEIDGFEETSRALSILDDREPQIALELGLDILLNNEGDQYLQGTIWGYFFFDNKELLIRTMNERSAPIENVLLADIVDDLLFYYPKLDVPKDFLEKLADAYEGYSQAEKDAVDCDFEKFLELYLPERR